MPPTSVFPIGAAVTLDELRGEDPYPVLARLRAGEPVSWLPALGGWLVTRRDLALRVMRDPDAFTVDDPRFSTARVVGPSMLSLDGAEHAQHRDPFEDPFRLGETRRRFMGFVTRETGRLVAAVEPAGAAELRRSVAGPLAVAVVVEALGLHGIDTAQVLSWYEAMARAVSGVSAGEPVAATGTAAFGRLRTQIEAALTTRRVQSVLTAAADGGLDRQKVVSNAAVFMFGGIETTDGMIVNAAWHLLGHPDQLTLVRADPSLLPSAVEESLRLEPAAAVVDRYATRDLALGEATIRRGDLVTVSLLGANRDPATFPEPDRFDIRRPGGRQHAAFAHGPHVCLGMHLARLETTIALRTLLDRLPGLRLDPARPGAPRGLVFRKPPAVWVRWDPSRPDPT